MTYASFMPDQELDFGASQNVGDAVEEKWSLPWQLWLALVYAGLVVLANAFGLGGFKGWLILGFLTLPLLFGVAWLLLHTANAESSQV